MRAGMVAAGGLAAALTFGARGAQAESDFVNVGYLHSFRWGDGLGSGNGAEVTCVHYPKLHIGQTNIDVIGIGAFFHFEATGPGDSLAFTLGPQVNLAPFGVEAGIEYAGGAADRDDTFGIYVGPFVSVGLLALGWHAIIPVAGPSGPSGLHHALTLALKLPLQVGGSSYAFFH